MKDDKIISDLEAEWEMPCGFFSSLRVGIFQPDRVPILLRTLQNIDITGEHLNRRLVSLVWFIPIFMIWQKERVIEKGGDIELLERVINEVTSLLEQKLGVP